MQKENRKVVHKIGAWLLTAAMVSGSVLGAGMPKASAAGYDVKLSKSSVSLTVKKSKGAVKCESVKITIKKSKGIKIKKAVCKAKKGSIASAKIKGKSSPVLTAKAKKKGNTEIKVTVTYKKGRKVKTKKLTLKASCII